MKKWINLFYLLFSFLLLSCYSGEKAKNQHTTNAEKKYIYTVISSDSTYSVTFTENGHTLIFKKDLKSDNGYIAYYVKFDDNAGKYDNAKQKVVRLDLDSSLNSIKSILTVNGIAICEKDENDNYKISYYDESKKVRQINNIFIHPDLLDNAFDGKNGNIGKRIFEMLVVAHELCLSISKDANNSWSINEYALQEALKIEEYDNIVVDNLYDINAQNHYERTCRMAKDLSRLYNVLQSPEM